MNGDGDLLIVKFLKIVAHGKEEGFRCMSLASVLVFDFETPAEISGAVITAMCCDIADHFLLTILDHEADFIPFARDTVVSV